MERYVQFDPIFIRHFTTGQWPFPTHNHNHYELVFIHAGKGMHVLNNARTEYSDKALFLLAPQDQHKFVVHEETEFSVIKFLPIYLSGDTESKERRDWNLLMDELIVNNEEVSAIILIKKELKKVEQLFRMIIREWEESDQQANELMVHLLRGVLVILKRNIFGDTGGTGLSTDNLSIGIMHHIHAHIQSPEALSSTYIAGKFHLSASYLGMLFRREMGISLKEYISQYKFKLIQARLKHSRDLLKEISHDFGFTDVSHFNKFVKKYSGQNPKDIRSGSAVL
ncbi:MAG: helix-turn-helix domain-containing protein [Chitinophaga sp.]|uniref:AraC family transcriptional regulator n=1 Tax=Chitinophaga sp. TaxID=1869181 RepID=UPI0025BF49FE|nr:AraC family transcriptional regulator [Chitinophaga sp.]MBV8253682.1 helix-turn-helix domain-containing protein [Chitinophaga sp.]